MHMRKTAPSVALRALVGLPDQLLDQVTEGVIDIAVLYAPRLKPGLMIEPLAEEKLVLVTTERSATHDPEAVSPDFIYVDWGPQFSS